MFGTEYIYSDGDHSVVKALTYLEQKKQKGNIGDGNSSTAKGLNLEHKKKKKHQRQKNHPSKKIEIGAPRLGCKALVEVFPPGPFQGFEKHQQTV